MIRQFLESMLTLAAQKRLYAKSVGAIHRFPFSMKSSNTKGRKHASLRSRSNRRKKAGK